MKPKIIAQGKYHSDAHNKQYYLLLQPSCRRTVFVIYDKYFLAFPQIAYFLTFSAEGWESETTYFLEHFRVYFVKDNIKSLCSKLYHPLMFNIDIRGGVCLGNLARPNFEETHIEEEVYNIISYFWTSTFTYDLLNTDPIVGKQMKRKKLRKWENESKKDPNYGLKLKFIQGYVKNIESLFKECFPFQQCFPFQ